MLDVKAETDIVPSSGNVFADLGFADAEERSFNAFLAMHIAMIIDEGRLTQKAAAALLGITQPKISKIKHGRRDAFSVEKLMHYLLRLNRNIEIRVVPNKAADAPARITLSSEIDQIEIEG
jgi:predicted XRE-type DNA-binding protein